MPYIIVFSAFFFGFSVGFLWADYSWLSALGLF